VNVIVLQVRVGHEVLLRPKWQPTTLDTNAR
jgi:hypothetical protein